MKIFSLQEQQLKLIEGVRHPLRYHLGNYQKAEKLAHPDWMYDTTRPNRFKEATEAMGVVKFEAYAYICQSGRLVHFLRSLEIKYGLQPPEDAELRRIWDDLHEGGTIHVLRNKWVTHRSFDDPRQGDTEQLHSEVLVNLDPATLTTYQGRHHKIMLGKEINFDLCDFHPRLETFLGWLGAETRQFTQRGNQKVVLKD